MAFYHFFICPLLSRAPLNKHFLDTRCFNNLDNMFMLLGVKGTGEFLPVNFECRKESIRKKSIRKKSIGKKESGKKVSGKKISLSFMYKG